MRKTQNLASKKSDAREPEDFKGSMDHDAEYEDVEESRTKSSRPEEADEVDDADIIDEIDLDASPEGDGPDA